VWRRHRFIAALTAFAAGLIGLASEARAAEKAPLDTLFAEEARPLPELPAEYGAQHDGWLTLGLHPALRSRAAAIEADANQARASLEEILGTGPLQAVDIRVTAIAGEIPRLCPVDPPVGSPLVVLPKLGAIALSTEEGATDGLATSRRLHHGLAHLALREATSGATLPVWFEEGFAEWASTKAGLASRWRLSIALLARDPLDLATIDASLAEPSPEAEAARLAAGDFFRFLHATSSRSFHRTLAAMRGGEKLEAAIASAYGTDLRSLERAWREDMARRYGFAPALLVSLFLTALLIVGARLRIGNVHETPRTPVEDRTTPRPSEFLASQGRAEQRALRALAARNAMAEDGARVTTEREVPKVQHGGRWHTLH
jgi:hypothetical protein